MKKKICTKCGNEKLLSKFSKDKSSKDGLQYYCKVCKSKIFKEWGKTKTALVIKIYHHQCSHSDSRGYHRPTYTRKELKKWLFSRYLFHKLFNDWELSDFKRDLIPSCDRKDDYKSYTLDNLQIITWRENYMKAHSDKINGINRKNMKAVIATHLTTGEKIEFYSMNQASREIGISHSQISRVCRGKRKSAWGYKWEYKF